MKGYNEQGPNSNENYKRWSYAVEAYNNITSEWETVEDELKFQSDAMIIASSYVGVPFCGGVKVTEHKIITVWEHQNADD